MKLPRPTPIIVRWSLCALLLLLGGCAEIPLATLGTVLGFAGNAASAGSEAYNLGKLDFSEMATLDECRSASLAAAADLQLHVLSIKPSGKREDEIIISLEDDLHKKLDVRIDRRAGRLCECRVDIGIFGYEPTARLVLDRIRAHLPQSARPNQLTTQP